MTTTIVCEGVLAESQEKTYVHLPFDVPSGATRLDVTFQYSDRIGSNPTLRGGNTIDLGLFDERGIDFLQAGFRGWSGSERSHFFITETTATPGYLPGTLNPGRWHILLGLYKIAPQGCTYRAEITITSSPVRVAAGVGLGVRDLSASPFIQAAGQAANDSWLRGELHCHTEHSDGVHSAAELVSLARARGLDFLAVADHNTIASQHELAALANPGLILLRGFEVTTFFGHFVSWGIPDWIDFRVQSPAQMQAVLDEAIKRGALTACAHPKPFGPAWDYPEVSNHHCVEVWNGPWTGLNQISLNYWLDLLSTGRRVVATGGSDYHRPGEGEGPHVRNLGTPTNWVYVPGEPDQGSILQAVRMGRVSLSDQPDGPLLVLTAGADGTVLQGDAVARSASLPVQVQCQRGAGCLLRLLDQRGMLFEQAIMSDDALVEVTLPVQDSLYVRAELRTPDNDWLRALTNPIYLTA